MSSLKKSRTIIYCLLLTLVLAAFLSVDYVKADNPATNEFINIGEVEGNLIPTGDFEASDSDYVSSGISSAGYWYSPSNNNLKNFEISNAQKYSGESSLAIANTAGVNVIYRFSNTVFKPDTEYLLSGYVSIPTDKTLILSFWLASGKEVVITTLTSTDGWAEISHVVSYGWDEEQKLIFNVDGVESEFDLASLNAIPLQFACRGTSVEKTYYLDCFSMFEIYDATVEIKSEHLPVTDLTAADFTLINYMGNDITDDVTVDFTNASEGMYTFEGMVGPVILTVTYDGEDKEAEIHPGNASHALIDFGATKNLTVSVVDENDDIITSSVSITCMSGGADVGLISSETDGTFSIVVPDALTDIVLTVSVEGYYVNEASINVVEDTLIYTFTAKVLVNIKGVEGNLIPSGEFEESDSEFLTTEGSGGPVGHWHAPSSSNNFKNIEISNEKKYSGNSSLAVTNTGALNTSYRLSAATFKPDTQYLLSGYVFIPTGKTLELSFFLASKKEAKMPTISATGGWVEFSHVVSYGWDEEQKLIFTIDDVDTEFEDLPSLSAVVLLLALRGGNTEESTYYFDRFSLFEIYDAQIELKTYLDPVPDLTAADFTLIDYMGKDITDDVTVDFTNAVEGKYKFKGIIGPVTLIIDIDGEENEVEINAENASKVIDYGTYFSVTIKVVDEANAIITSGVTITCKSGDVNIGQIKYNYNGTITISQLYGTDIVLTASVAGYNVNEVSINVVDGTNMYEFTAVKIEGEDNDDDDKDSIGDNAGGCKSAFSGSIMVLTMLLLSMILFVIKQKKLNK